MVRQSFTKVPLSKYPPVAATLETKGSHESKKERCLCLRTDQNKIKIMGMASPLKHVYYPRQVFRGLYNVYPTASLYGMFTNTSVLFTFTSSSSPFSSQLQGCNHHDPSNLVLLNKLFTKCLVQEQAGG